MWSRTHITTVCAVLTLSAPLTAGDVVDIFQAKYSKLKTVACSFRDAHGTKGTLKAMKGGYYRISVPDREIICDGTTVWNIVPSTKTVVLNTYKPTSDEVSLERLFFLMLNIYRPTIVKSTSKGSTIRLTAPREDAVIANINEAEIDLDNRNAISVVRVREYGASTTWYLSKLVVNRSVPTSSFTFKIPKGWQRIDLR